MGTARCSAPAIIALSALLFRSASAQLLTNGNSQLPSCAATCTLLNQAAQACSGTATADQGTWSCFCQSAYLKTLYTTPNGVCDQFCTNPSDNQQVMTWYTSNCGSDNGAIEHAGSATGATTVVVTSTSMTSTTTAAAATSDGVQPTTTASGGSASVSNLNTSNADWWSIHYRWVIMLIVLFVSFILIAIVAVLLKRRHDRKQDRIREGFNAGITSRTTPMITITAQDGAAGDSTFMSGAQPIAGGGWEAGGGRNSPARTREVFMPYGYSYTRSESRLGSRGDLDGRKSPVPRGMAPVEDLEKEVGIGAANADTPRSVRSAKKGRRVMVRERSVEGPESPVAEKERR
ncbi:hypothetical protein BAUCODRAFT_80748 [Baudoinia panamericana UAMH 10762]|uniref:Extracellular membrane protein CFEM domain-containing protein n=1 Tax=Baudoinia panamericana (strain UAMH 10762) TaxID=717646 RepID=M2LAI4_BAUPA|nr:uncharacterized protein BAUCODRAFT_80748 [Baudoinia panamericana UAMH 10762]EMC90822.1 hypothetical protein BAUCODRAFT_80748 [Baudoinia panamericana UAMH 10762]